MSNFVDLCSDSDDDGAVATVAAFSTTGRRGTSCKPTATATAIAREKTTTITTTKTSKEQRRRRQSKLVSPEGRKQPKVATTKHEHEPRKPRALRYDYDSSSSSASSSSDDSVPNFFAKNRKKVCQSKTKSKTKSAKTTLQSSPSKSKSPSKLLKAKREDVAKHTATAGRSIKEPRELQYDSDSDSDDSLLRQCFSRKIEAKAQVPSFSSSTTKAAVRQDTKKDEVIVLLADSPQNKVKQSIYNPYAKAKPKQQQQQQLSHRNHGNGNSSIASFLQQHQHQEQEQHDFPDVRGGCGKHKYYPDLRPRLILAFWKYSHSLQNASYKFARLDSYAQRITALALSDLPIRSIEEYTHRFANADATGIKEALTKGGYNANNNNLSDCRNGNQYYSIVEAALVAVLEFVEEKTKSASTTTASNTNANDIATLSSQKEYWMYLSDLLPAIDARLKPNCPGSFAADANQTIVEDSFSTMATTSNSNSNSAAARRSAEFKQLEKLTTLKAVTSDPSSVYLKPHRQQKQSCYELTTYGYEAALRIRTRSFPVPPSPHYRSSSNVNVVATSNDDNVGEETMGNSHATTRIVLAVDLREGGGPTNHLHHVMCATLDRRKIPYIVTKLDIGDYCFFVNNNNKQQNAKAMMLLPILVERKSIQDVAHSIHDGRWTSQKKRMYQGQFVFGFGNRSSSSSTNNSQSRLAYIIEGSADAHQLATGNIGDQNHNVSREQLDKEIEKLESEGFEVLRTTNPKHSMTMLATWTEQVMQDYRQGSITAEFTYEEFLRQVKKIPRDTDFSRIAIDHMETVKQAELETLKTTKQPPGEYSPSVSFPANEKPQILVESKPKSKTRDSAGLYNSYKLAELKEKCGTYGLPKTGTKAVLIKRLSGPRPPAVWVERKVQKLYVPSRHDTCASAILVSIWLEQQSKHTLGISDWKGLDKDNIMTLAERLDISKDPMTGKAATGPFAYDGWAAMSSLKDGENPLVFRNKGGFFKLTSPHGMSLSEGIHGWCHDHGVCSCQQLGYEVT